MGFKMKYSIKKQYLTGPSSRRPKILMPEVGFMVGHDTGNPGSTAAGNVGYYERSRNVMQASAHIFVDDKEIIECIPLLTGTPEKAWHVIYNVTTDNRMYGDDANDIAGGVELCWGSGINSKEAYKRYIWVLAYACYKFKLDPAKEIVGHDVLDPGRKIDPTNGLKYMGLSYQQMLNDVVKEYNDCLGKKEKTPASSISGKTYKIQTGDIFWSIAQRMKGVSVQDLKDWNPTVNPASLTIGQVINVSKPSASSNKKATHYTIKKGDTLWSIAKDKKISVDDLEKWNPKVDAGALKIGSKLIVGYKEASKPAPKPKKPAKKWSFPKTLRYGAKGNDVLHMQKGLCEAYFYPEKGKKNNGCDGSFGPATENAVRRFQMVHTPSMVDGIFGPATRKALENLLNN